MNHIFRYFLIALCALPMWVDAANQYVRPGATGLNNGSDWTNAHTQLPRTLTRGDTYYLADGIYGSYVFNTPNAGTALIDIKKATEANHGTNTGWSSAYGDGQAVFNRWEIHTDYYVFDGQRRNGDWHLGTTTEYGIKVAGNGPVRLDNGAGVGGDNLTFRYIDFQGGGRDTNNRDDVIYGLTGNSNLTFQYCALHDSDRTIFLMRGNWRNLIVDHSYVARNTSTPVNHGEMVSMTDSTNVTWSNNVMEDIEGTAFIAGINGGTASNWKIFGNVAFHSAAYIADVGRQANHNFGVTGIVFIANDASNDNYGNGILFYNNTMVNIQGLWSGVIIQSGSGNEVRNNVWHNSVRTNNSFAGEISHNWYYNTIQDGDTSQTKLVCTSTCDVFTSISGKDFRPKVAIAGGTALGAPYSIDANGITRGADGNWDRGAYEFGGTANPSMAFDLDGSGSCDSKNDAVLMLRYLTGMRDDALTTGLIFGANARTPAQIATHLSSLGNALDVDGDGKTLATTDALMFMRYTLLLTDSSLTTNARNQKQDGVLKSDTEIKRYFDDRCGVVQ